MFGERLQIASNPDARFSNVSKLFGRHKSLCIFKKNTFQLLKLGSFLISEMLKEQVFTTTRMLDLEFPELVKREVQTKTAAIDSKVVSCLGASLEKAESKD